MNIFKNNIIIQNKKNSYYSRQKQKSKYKKKEKVNY